MTASRARLAVVVATLGLSTWGCGSTGQPAGAGNAGNGGGGVVGSAGASGSAGATGSAGAVGEAGGTGTAGATATAGAGSTGTAGTGAAGAPPPDGGGAGNGGGDASTALDAPGSIGDGAPGTAALTQFLRIIQVTTVQGTQTVSISIDGTKNHNGTIHAGQALMMRIHVRPDTGWVAHPTVAELHLVNASIDVIIVSAPRTITGASTAANLESTFNFDLTAEQVTKDLKFNVALRDPTGTPETPPPAVQRALYPRTGALDTLDAQ